MESHLPVVFRTLSNWNEVASCSFLELLVNSSIDETIVLPLDSCFSNELENQIQLICNKIDSKMKMGEKQFIFLFWSPNLDIIFKKPAYQGLNFLCYYSQSTPPSFPNVNFYCGEGRFGPLGMISFLYKEEFHSCFSSQPIWLNHFISDLDEHYFDNKPISPFSYFLSGLKEYQMKSKVDPKFAFNRIFKEKESFYQELIKIGFDLFLRKSSQVVEDHIWIQISKSAITEAIFHSKDVLIEKLPCSFTTENVQFAHELMHSLYSCPMTCVIQIHSSTVECSIFAWEKNIHLVHLFPHLKVQGSATRISFLLPGFFLKTKSPFHLSLYQE